MSRHSVAVDTADARRRRFARRPDFRPRLHIELGEMGHEGKVIVAPGPDDWFGATEISQFMTRVEVDAKVGDATRTTLHVIRATVELPARLGGQLVPEITLPRTTWFWRWKRRFIRKIIETTTIRSQTRRYQQA